MKRAVFISLAIALLSIPTVSYAEITHPYIVDEKPQVWFGDSADILVPNEDHTATSTYFGMENYKQDYVDGYAHITFSYTHGINSFASCPPVIYVTSLDPRTTDSPLEKSWMPAYQISPYFIPSDWYSYDIQFDDTGYTVIVKQAGEREIFNDHRDINGLTETDWVALANYYTYVPDNPGMMLYSMAFTPVPVKNSIQVSLDPVIIIPGIAGSKLYKGEDLIWLDLNQMLADINDQFLTESLSLDLNGNSLVKINPVDLIYNAGNIDFFGSLITSLENKRYQKNQSYFVFPYDWRLDLNETKNLLNQKIEEVKNQTGKEKVNIVAHSMGGLLTKAYLEEYGKGSVNKLIFVGTPHLGAPKAGKILLEGDRLSIPWLEEDRLREIAENSPALHELLPNPKYFSYFQGYLRNYKLFGENPLMGYGDTKNFFLNEKAANSIMFQKAEDFNNKNLDILNFDGIETYNIAGCKTPTQSAYSFGIGGGIAQTGYTSGDGTVPMVSAEYIRIPVENKYYVKDGNHAELPSAEGVRDLILNILNNETTQPPQNVSNDSSFCNFKGKKLTWHSPVEIHIYDAHNNHTGPIENNAIEYGVPGIDYDIMGHDKFIFLPTDSGQEYAVKAIGLENKSFDLSISEVENGKNTVTQVFNDVPITLSSVVNFSVNNNTDNDVIELSKDGVKEEIKADAVLEGDLAMDLILPETEIVLNGKEYKDGEFKKEVGVSLWANDVGSGILSTWYSVNSNDFQKYTGPFIIEEEGVFNIHYYSIDKAGNNEEAKNSEIIIGKLSKYLRNLE